MSRQTQIVRSGHINHLAIKLESTVLLIVLLLAGLRLEAATLRVLVLDGLASPHGVGRRFSHPELVLNLLVKRITDQQGVCETEVDLLPRRVAIYVKGRLPCNGKYRGTSVQSVDVIISVGVVESNDCNSKVNHRREPGMLVLFVRRASLPEILD